MPIHKGTLYIHAAEFIDDTPFKIYSHDMSDCGRVLLGTHDFEVEYPAPTKDPIEAEIEGLEKEHDRINKEAMAKMELLTQRIKDLRCIEFKG